MYGVMSAVMLAMNLGANCFAVIIALITGQPFSNGLVPLGISVHLITSTIIGAIFGTVISSVNKLRITGFAKGIGLGVVTGLIAFVVIFLPIALTVMPPKMTDLMKAMSPQMMTSGNNNGAMMSGGSSSSAMMSSDKMQSSNTSSARGIGEKSTMSGNSAISGKSGMMSISNNAGMNSQMAMMSDMAKLQSMNIEGSLLGHVIYGAVLGSVVTILLMRTRRGETKISR
jgi:hypothetical protein